ncbi:hypothetical protein GGX14DRAFT_407175 [Mycena pura]|uniref:Uncharacterized protein n=1 Tax=Mycena pura TaxID=153505 RepID=A0AAD6UNC8_9AGAR|nr:hypothetical protein GGX14DRAFT_407175 [Mycena pura]
MAVALDAGAKSELLVPNGVITVASAFLALAPTSLSRTRRRGDVSLKHPAQLKILVAWLWTEPLVETLQPWPGLETVDTSRTTLEFLREARYFGGASTATEIHVVQEAKRGTDASQISVGSVIRSSTTSSMTLDMGQRLAMTSKSEEAADSRIIKVTLFFSLSLIQVMDVELSMQPHDHVAILATHVPVALPGLRVCKSDSVPVRSLRVSAHTAFYMPAIAGRTGERAPDVPVRLGFRAQVGAAQVQSDAVGAAGPVGLRGCHWASNGAWARSKRRLTAALFNVANVRAKGQEGAIDIRKGT